MFRKGVRIILFIAALASGSISCRPVTSGELEGSDFENVSPLESTQVTILSDTVDSIGRVEMAALEAKNIAKPQNDDPIRAEIREALLKAQCEIKHQNRSNIYGIRSSHLIVNGTSCPAQVRIESKHNPSSDLQGYRMSAEISITDPSLRQKNDFFEIQISGRGHYRMNGKNGSLNFETVGFARSDTKGTVRITGSNAQNFNFSNEILTVSGVQEIQMSFPPAGLQKEFTVELRSIIDIQEGQDRSRYTRNGVEISKQEYQGYLAKFGLIFN